jgi:hypothetical protein
VPGPLVVAVAQPPAPVAEGQATYIAVLAVDRAGASVAYRKMWLGDEEAARFSPGPAPARITVDGHRLWVAVASFAGPTGGGYHETAGRSGIWAPDGALITGTGSRSGEATSATFDQGNMEGLEPESRLPIRGPGLAGEARAGGWGLGPRGQHGQPRTSGRRWSRLGIEVRTWAVNDVSTSATATPG